MIKHLLVTIFLFSVMTGNAYSEASYTFSDGGYNKLYAKCVELAEGRITKEDPGDWCIKARNSICEEVNSLGRGSLSGSGVTYNKCYCGRWKDKGISYIKKGKYVTTGEILKGVGEYCFHLTRHSGRY